MSTGTPSLESKSLKLPTKRRRLRRWAIGLAVTLPVLYVLSSGPLVFLISSGRLNQSRQVNYEMHDGRVYATEQIGPGPIVQAIYTPVFWMGKQSWGTPLLSYWTLFVSDTE